MTIRVALCADFPEEHWPSMDRVAATLLEYLRRNHAGTIDITPVVPRFARRATRLSGRAAGAAYTVDRLVNRLWDYPRHVANLANNYDVFHVIDHSYAHLVHRLPPGRAVVTCHDLDTFRSLLHPGDEPRSRPYNAMMARVLTGLQRAARVTCHTAVVRDELIARRLLRPERVIIAPVGAGPEFSSRADPEADRAAARLTGSTPGCVELLHVGSAIPRKRVDVLLRIFAELRAEVADARLVRAGGPLTSGQRQLARDLGIDDHMVVLDALDDRTLAAIYRRAALVLLPSDREGFGFPMVEAMACGTPVVASDLVALREIGGPAVEYCAPGAVPLWRQRIVELLGERQRSPDAWHVRVDAGLARASCFQWPQFAERMAQVYGEVAVEADPRLARSPA